MATFKPPTDNFVRWSDGFDDGIFAYLSPWPRGRNVFKLVDGSFTEHQPMDQSSIAITYHGGHIHPITADEEQDLRDAGYGDYITV
jgi:hypothetical protein